MKLELKHFDIGNEFYGASDIWKVTGYSIDYVYIDNGAREQELTLENLQVEYSLLRRPLSGLTKDDKFLEFCKGEITCANLKVTEHEGLIGIEVLGGDNELIAMYGEIAAECSYIFYQYLVENHYDINGLIESGLAIDKNTIK